MIGSCAWVVLESHALLKGKAFPLIFALILLNSLVSATVGTGISYPDLEARWSEGLEALLVADRAGRAATHDAASIDRIGDDGWSASIDEALSDIRAGHIVLVRDRESSGRRAVRRWWTSLHR